MKCVCEKWKMAVELIRSRAETPFYAFSAPQITHNIAKFQKAFKMSGRSVEFFYSVKTNAATDIATLVKEAGWGLLASSEGDLDVARRVGTRALIFDAPIKTDAELEVVSQFISPVIVCQNKREFEHAINFAPSARFAMLGLRVTIPCGVSGHASRFGFDVEYLASKTFVKQSKKFTGLFSGVSLHFHVGGTPATAKQFSALASFVMDTWKRLRSCKLDIQAFSFGGGIPSGLSEVDLKEYGDAVRNALADAGVPETVKIWFEPGRAIVEDAGILCVTVLDISLRDGQTYALVDGGSNLAMPAWMLGEHKRSIERVDSKRRGEQHGADKITIVGPMCAENDRLGEIDGAAGISSGDCLILKNIGAYDWSTRYFFGRRMPAAFIVQSKGNIQLLQTGNQLDAGSVRQG